MRVGNLPAQQPLETWAAGRGEARFRFHNWWDSPSVRAAAAEIYAGEATHASWFETFRWTRLEGVELPAGEKPMVTDREALRELEPEAVRSVTARTAGRTPCRTSRPGASGTPASPRSGR